MNSEVFLGRENFHYEFRKCLFVITRTLRIKNLNLVENSMALIAQLDILRYEFSR